MKNVHLLPTDKPSRLLIDTIENKLYLQGILHEKTINVSPQNIYITNDEEIKIDDYYLGEDNNLYCLVSKVNSNGKKIILTTDEELIAEGVQPIDDEFLEWFVKNPSCEEVKIEDYGNLYNFRYLVLIPQKESKQETLEEAAEKYVEDWNGTIPADTTKLDFIAGAKWMERQMKK